MPLGTGSDKQSGEKSVDNGSAIFADLKHFLETEFQEVDKHVEDPFRPLTEGLGLESPRLRPELEDKLPRKQEGTPSILDSSVDESIQLDDSGAISGTSSLLHNKKKMTLPQEPTQKPSMPAQVEKAKEGGLAAVVGDVKVPPPLPAQASVSLGRRVLAGFLDQLFVFSLWTVSLVITLKIITGSFVGIGGETPIVIRDSDFIQFALVQYLAIWTCYSILCLALLDMTFGMWIWGIKVDFSSSRGNLILRKFGRAFLNIFFQAPIVPTVLLLFRAKSGKNILDFMTGTRVARTN